MSALKPTNEISPSYLAGLLDGEGCISKTRKGTYRVTIGMNATAETLLRKIHAQFGGKFHSYDGKAAGMMFTWNLYSKPDIKRVLTLILPFMLLDYKIVKAKDALIWCDTEYFRADHLNVQVISCCVDCGEETTTNLPNKNRCRCEKCRRQHMTYYWQVKWQERKPTYVRACPA